MNNKEILIYIYKFARRKLGCLKRKKGKAQIGKVISNQAEIATQKKVAIQKKILIPRKIIRII